MTDTTNITIAAGLTLARKLLNDDRAAFVVCHIVPEAGLSADDQAIADSYTAAIATITGAAAEIQRLTAQRDALAARLAEIERAEPVAWMHADRRMSDGWAPRSARAENFVGWSPLIYIPGVAPQPPAAEPAARRPLPADGCGACGDACRSRGSCQLADESPEIEQRGTPCPAT